MDTSPLKLNLQAGGSLTGLASDARSLDKLRLAATADPAKAVKQVATQFEALFMQTVLKSMREASLKSGLLDSSDQQMYTGMLDEQLAQKIAAGGTGLADVIARQLSRNLPSTPAATAAPAGAPPAMATVPPAPAATPAVATPVAVLGNLRAAAAVRQPR